MQRLMSVLPLYRRRIHRLLVADHKDSLRQPSHHRIHIFDPLDNERASGAALDGGGGESVNVWMIPIKPWWLVLREMKLVAEGVARINDCTDHFILVASRRSI